MVRRIFGIVLVIALLMSAAYAEIDVKDALGSIKDLEDSDLYLLRDAIIAEIEKREFPTSDIMYQGMYLVGEHLEAGSYLFMGTGVSEYGDCLYVYTNRDEYNDTKTPAFFQCVLSRREIANVILSDGNLVYVTPGAVFCLRNPEKAGWEK